MSPNVLKVGLIGFGLPGRYFHAPFLAVHPGFRLAKAVSPKAVAANSWSTDCVVKLQRKPLRAFDESPTHPAPPSKKEEIGHVYPLNVLRELTFTGLAVSADEARLLI